MFKPVDISEKLKCKKNRDQHLMSTVRNWLWEEELLESGLFEVSDKNDNSHLDGDLEIYCENDIKKICIEYNLRFLNKKHFKDEIPYEAIIQLKRLKKKYDFSFLSFKILAPSSKFKLKDDMEDPILFGQIENDEYLLIHKWGHDIKWIKKLQAYPYRNIQCLIKSILCIAIAVGLILPNSLLTLDPQASYLNIFRFITMFWLFIVFSAGILFYWMVSRSSFSEHVWNSKYH